MPYISMPTAPLTIGEGRTARNVTYHGDDQSNWIAEVDEVLVDENEITAEQYAEQAKANAEHNAKIVTPEPATQPVKPSLLEILLADKNLAPETKTALAALRG